MSETFTLYKLIILYMLNKVDFPLTTSQISEFVLDIDDFLTEKQYDLKEEVSVKADYYLNTNQEYETRCQIVENGFSLIDLKLTVPTEKEAKAITNHWNLKSQEIYTLLLTNLL